MMTVEPSATEVTTPVTGSTVATVGSELDHVPPEEASVNDAVEDIQIEDGPVIAIELLTVTVSVAVPHPLENVIIATPPPTPVKIPEVASTEATVDASLNQVPPVEGSVKVSTVPIHKLDEPEILAGAPFTVTGSKDIPQVVV